MIIVFAGLPLKCTIMIRLDIFADESKNADILKFISYPIPPYPFGVAEEYSKRHVSPFSVSYTVPVCAGVCQRCS
jgi:hypothetical protein